MVFCSIQEAYGSNFESSRASYNSPPCSSQQFNPNDPYFALAGASSSPPALSVELENLRDKVETFVSSGSQAQRTEAFGGSRERLDNILHCTLVAIFTGLLVDHFT
uniref:Uncharacterized protein n=1 Tax=viral metagenome TaxID=1070528 RepID=A0A6C0K9S5_9ZZZZ